MEPDTMTEADYVALVEQARGLLGTYGPNRRLTKDTVEEMIEAITTLIAERDAAFERGRAAGIEEAAAAVRGLKTCGCNGTHGRCMEDDPFDYAAETITALKDKPA